MTPLTPEYREARKVEHEAGKHADPAFVATTYMYVVGDDFVAGCPLCEAEEEADLACPECGEGELEPIGDEAPVQ